ncbi:hypothetical protein ACFLTU_05285 [Bacteroidota bacterium]
MNPAFVPKPVVIRRTHDYLYIRNFEADRWPTGGPEYISSNKTNHGDVDACPTKAFLVANQENMPGYYDLNFGKRPSEELYEVHTDPGQIKNLANDPSYSEVREDLSQKLLEYLRETGDPRVEGKDPWKEHIYHQASGYGSTYNMSLPEHERERAKLRPSNHPDQKFRNQNK